MKAYLTKDGFVFWGRTAYDIVSRMRRADIFHDHESNADYMETVAERVKEMKEDDYLRFTNEEEFLKELVGFDLLTEVTKTHECPIAHTFCSSPRSSCSGDKAYCWLKKQESSQ